MTLSRPSVRAASLLLAAAIGMTGTLLLTHASPVRADTVAGDTVTVFVDATLGFRKNHMAKKLTETHAEYAARGYHVVDLEAYNENGDLVGFFVTYAR